MPTCGPRVKLNVHFSSRSYKRHLEHLFYVSDPEINEREEIMRIIEEGFKENEQHSVRILAQLSVTQVIFAKFRA